MWCCINQWTWTTTYSLEEPVCWHMRPWWPQISLWGIIIQIWPQVWNDKPQLPYDIHMHVTSNSHFGDLWGHGSSKQPRRSHLASCMNSVTSKKTYVAMLFVASIYCNLIKFTEKEEIHHPLTCVASPQVKRKNRIRPLGWQRWTMDPAKIEREQARAARGSKTMTSSFCDD